MAPLALDAAARTAPAAAAQQLGRAPPQLHADRPAARLLPALLRGVPAALARGACTGALVATLAFAPLVAGAAELLPPVSNDTPVLDLAHVVPSGKLPALQQDLLTLERETGWRVRVLTSVGPSPYSVESLRKGWSTGDGRTVVVLVDPTAPNIMSFKYGLGVQGILNRAFFAELQSRYGNLFAVREQGEGAVVLGAMDALTGCLRRGGCAVVPGLSQDHYFFTLLTSVAGGVVAGAVSRLEPQGFVKNKVTYLALFSPLWGPLFIAFGLGPIWTRTDDTAPLLANCLAFLATVLAVGWGQDLVARLAGVGPNAPGGSMFESDED